MFKPARKPGRAVPLTEARARLFPLVDDLLAGRTDRVALSRRGVDEQVLLVRARDVERMEAELAELRKRVAPEPRPLAGYATVIGDVEEMLREARREANERYEAKMARIFGDLPPEPSVDTASAADQPPRDPAAIRGLGRRASR
ncbi:hypothetical protein tb265_04600 [Gemmatimonadetes bacterium T265]|nr:hypothetical protein tb265_04600 [Gemmatimonadetes bacterium T265]